MAPAVEWHRGLLDVLVRGGGTRRQEAGSHPAEETVGRDVVGCDDNDALAATGADPVLGQADRLRRARARGVDLGVRSARTDQLGELRVPHRQDAEQEAPVERVSGLLQGELQVVDPPVDLGQHGCLPVGFGDLGPHCRQRVQLLAARCVEPEAGQLVGEIVVAGEGRGEDDSGVVAQLVGEHPPVGQLGADARRPVVVDERDSGVAQRVDAGADGELGLAPEGGDPVGVDAELLAEVEFTRPPRQLDHVGGAVDRLEACAGLALHQPGDVLVQHLVADPRRDHVDPLLAVQDAGDVGVIEDVRRAGQAERGSRDDDWLGGSRPVIDAAGRCGWRASSRRPVPSPCRAHRGRSPPRTARTAPG